MLDCRSQLDARRGQPEIIIRNQENGEILKRRVAQLTDLSALQEVQEEEPMYMMLRPRPSVHVHASSRRRPISRSRSA